MSRQYRLQYPPQPPPPYSYTVVVLVAVAVEFIRSELNPEIFQRLVHPYWLISSSLAATFALHVWSIQDSLPKNAVSAFFTQSSMPTVLLITLKLAEQITVAISAALKEITKI